MKISKLAEESGIDFVRLFSENDNTQKIAWYTSFDPDHILGCIVSKDNNKLNYHEYILPKEVGPNEVMTYIEKNELLPEYTEELEY